MKELIVKIEGIIKRAKNACLNSNVNVEDLFVDVAKMVSIISGAKRKGLKYREDVLDNIGKKNKYIGTNKNKLFYKFNQ